VRTGYGRPMTAVSIRQFLADPDRPGSLADRSRRARRARLLAHFPDLESMTVVDLGGTAGFWRHLGLYPADLTLVNVADYGGSGVRMLIGDACDPPSAVRDRTYDLVLCNSVIDQVGGLERRKRLAATIGALAPGYWVQTAARSFPVDAYFLFPFFAHLPLGVRVAIVRRWRLTHLHTTEPIEARRRVESIELQSARNLQALFPDAQLIRERFAGVTKSLIAVRAH
jgi:hypothetical protein